MVHKSKIIFNIQTLILDIDARRTFKIVNFVDKINQQLNLLITFNSNIR